MIQRKIFKDKEDWAEFRKGYFTSSESIKLLSDPKLKADKEAGKLSDGAITYVLERTAQLVAPTEPEFYNAKMERGNTLEPQAALAIAQRFGIDTNDSEFIYTSVGGHIFFYDDDYNCGGTPDIILTGMDAICEIKCPDSKQHLRYMLLKTESEFAKSCPDYYNQMQQNMWLCEKSKGYFVSYDDRYFNEKHHLFVLEIQRNEDHINGLKAKLIKAKELKDSIINLIQTP